MGQLGLDAYRSQPSLSTLSDCFISTDKILACRDSFLHKIWVRDLSQQYHAIVRFSVTCTSASWPPMTWVSRTGLVAPSFCWTSRQCRRVSKTRNIGWHL